MHLHPSPQDFRNLAEHHNLVAVWAELAADYETPLAAFRKIARPGTHAFLLESAENTQVSGRYWMRPNWWAWCPPHSSASHCWAYAASRLVLVGKRTRILS